MRGARKKARIAARTASRASRVIEGFTSAVPKTLTEISAEIPQSLRSDKSAHYLQFYEELIGARRDRPMNVLELGVFNGGSLLMFGKYLERARILGIDIQMPPPSFFSACESMNLADRVSVELGSQDDAGFLSGAVSRYFQDQKLDLIIDDASHRYSPTKASFDALFETHLTSGGIYVLEDWGCGYWPKWPDGHRDGRHGLPKLVKEWIDEIALPDRTKLFRGKRSIASATEERFSPIQRMTILPGIMALYRA